MASCFCEECFDVEIHKLHNFTLTKYEYYCDCGDSTYLKTESFVDKGLLDKEEVGLVITEVVVD